MEEMKAYRDKIHIAVVDDHPIFRYGIISLIEKQRDMRVYAEWSGSEDLPSLIRKTQPDIVIMDVSLENQDGIALTRKIRSEALKVPIIMLSMHESRVHISRAMRAGANGYVTKSQSAEKLIDAIREVRQGRIFITGNNSESIRQSLSARHASEEKPVLDLLSDRERQIFTLIGRGYTTIEIAEKLHIKPKTVETYRSRIKEKLELDSAQRLSMAAISWATQEGLASSTVS